MLVTPNLFFNKQSAEILGLIGQGGMPTEIEKGIYLSPSFSFGNNIIDGKEDYFSFDNYDLPPYGVCDNIEQVKEKYKKWIEDDNFKCCISFTKVEKSAQSERDGWRWEKWGEYIGTKNPECEYLYDEGDEIKEVYCYHIYQILN
jgi:hypothetical protein